MKEPYAYSKKAAEEEAWKFAKGKKWDLVAICPSFIIGPPLSKRVDATSIQAVKRLLEGAHQETVRRSEWCLSTTCVVRTFWPQSAKRRVVNVTCSLRLKRSPGKTCVPCSSTPGNSRTFHWRKTSFFLLIAPFTTTMPKECNSSVSWMEWSKP